MNKLLLDKGYLNFEKLVLDFYLKLGLTDLEAFILIKLYYLKKETNYLSYNKLQANSCLSKKEIEDACNSLMLKGILAFETIEVNSRLEESFNIYGFLTKISQLANLEPKEDLIRLVEENFNKVLSSKDLEILSQINATKEEITRAIIICLQNNVTEVSYLKKVIENEKRG